MSDSLSFYERMMEETDSLLEPDSLNTVKEDFSETEEDK